MTNQLRNVAYLKVGSVKGNSRVYPQLRLPSQYADLAGKKASIYEISENEGYVAFIIRFDSQNQVAAHQEARTPQSSVCLTGAKLKNIA